MSTCFQSGVPDFADHGLTASPVTKSYSYGRTGELVVSCHQSGETSVSYAPSSLVFTAPAGCRGAVFTWASDRRQHMRSIGL